MKRLVLLITAICIAKIGLSQTDYRNGFIITNAGDTLFGLVDYRVGAKAYQSCDFKSSKDQTVVTYEPNNIVGYGFENDKTFQSRMITIKDQPSKVVFLEILVSGLVSLYKLENTFFIEKEHDGLQQLVNETKIVSINGRDVIKKSNQYIGTLNILLFDCLEVKTKVQKVKLDEKSLTILIEDYNRCKGVVSISFKAKKPWTKTIVGITTGLNISQLNFGYNLGYKHLIGDFEVSKSPTAGISLDILSPRLSEKISLHGDLLYLNSTYYNYTQYNESYSIERNYVTIELQQLKIPIGIRYSFPQRKFTPYFNVGIASTIHISSVSKWLQEVESNSVVNTNEYEALSLKNKQFGLWGGAGIFKPIVNNKLIAFIELRYEQTDGIAPFYGSLTVDSKISNFQIFVGIRTK